MKPDLYQIDDQEGWDRIRKVKTLDGKQETRVSLPQDEARFWDSLRYAEDACEHLTEFFDTFEQFKKAEQEKYLEQYRQKGKGMYRDYAEEIGQLTIDIVIFFGGVHPNEAEVRCHELPGTFRIWFCGYADGCFFHLGYDD